MSALWYVFSANFAASASNRFVSLRIVTIHFLPCRVAWRSNLGPWDGTGGQVPHKVEPPADGGHLSAATHISAIGTTDSSKPTDRRDINTPPEVLAIVVVPRVRAVK